MIVAEGFSPFSPSEGVSLVREHRPVGAPLVGARVYALDDHLHTTLPDLALANRARD